MFWFYILLIIFASIPSMILIGVVIQHYKIINKIHDDDLYFKRTINKSISDMSSDIAHISSKLYNLELKYEDVEDEDVEDEDVDVDDKKFSISDLRDIFNGGIKL